MQISGELSEFATFGLKKADGLQASPSPFAPSLLPPGAEAPDLRQKILR